MTLSLVILLSFLIRAFFLSRVEMVMPDEVYYIRLGQYWTQGGLPDLVSVPYRTQPLLPYLFSWFSRIGEDPLLPCQWLSLIIGVATLIPFHFSAKLLGGDAEARWSDFIYALSPFAIQYSVWAMNHSLYNFFLVLMLLFILKAKESGKLWWAALAGLAGCGAYLTRVEGIVFVFFLSGAGLFFSMISHFRTAPFLRLRFTAVFLLTFLVFSLPFWFWLWRVSGTWQLVWTEGYGASGVIWKDWQEVLNQKEYEGLHPLWGIGRFYLVNLAKIYYNFLPRALPLLIWFFVAFGAVQAFLRNERECKRVFIVMIFAAFPILFYPLRGVELRYLHPSLVFLLLFSGFAPHQFYGWLMKKRTFAALVFLCFLVLNFLPGQRNLLATFKEEPLEQKKLGNWIRSHFSEPQVIFGSDLRLCFYSGAACGKFVSMTAIEKDLPQPASFDSLLKDRGVHLVAVDTRYIPKYYPKFSFLRSSRFQTLSPLVEFQEGAEKITLYQLEFPK